jgi:hypothetical protein
MITAVASCSASCQNLKTLKHAETLKNHSRLENAASNRHAKAEVDELELAIPRAKSGRRASIVNMMELTCKRQKEQKQNSTISKRKDE